MESRESADRSSPEISTLGPGTAGHNGSNLNGGVPLSNVRTPSSFFSIPPANESSHIVENVLQSDVRLPWKLHSFQMMTKA